MPRRYCLTNDDAKICSCSMLSLYRFIEPLALFTLCKNGSVHGYELISLVNRQLLTETPIDGPALYRTLRVLEKHELVISEWEQRPGGPARRQYSMTPKGHQHLSEWRAVLSRLQISLSRFVGEIDQIASSCKTKNPHFHGGFMKIAFPFDGGVVSAHFGKCKTFLFVEVERSGSNISGKEERDLPESDEGCGRIPKWLVENKVNTVIAKGMGEGMRRNLEKAGVGVIFCKTADSPEELAVSYAKGLLTSTPLENACDHGPDHVCGDHGHGQTPERKHKHCHD
ncbi:MAG: NifB/NifX family molybdenum-iron cluster-binding protein [Candidatus Ozemobacteraceae bacterium]